MPNTYNDEQIDTLLNYYFRPEARPMPFPLIADEMGVVVEWWNKSKDHPLYRVLWGLWTGYGNPVDADNPQGPRKRLLYTPTRVRVSRAGSPWYKREDNALRHALGGEGQGRVPRVDVAYIAGVLMRTPTEVQARWADLNKDAIERALGRTGFFGGADGRATPHL